MDLEEQHYSRGTHVKNSHPEPPESIYCQIMTKYGQKPMKETSWLNSVKDIGYIMCYSFSSPISIK